MVIAKYLFVNVAREMKRLNSNVGSTQRSLQKRPEILHAIDMHATAHVGLSLVDYIVNEAPLHPVVIGDRVVRVHRASKLHVLKNLVLQSLPRNVRHNSGANLTKIPVKDALHNRLTSRGSHKTFLSGESHTARTMHVFHLATDKGFIGLNFTAFAADLRGIPPLLFLHYFADALEHEPCSRLGDSQGASKFVRTDTVLGVRQKPKRRHPLIKADGGIFHDRLNLDRELPLAGIAKPELAGLDERVLRGIAARTSNLPVRPAQFLGKLKSAVGIGKVDNGLLQRFWLWKVLSGVHIHNDITRSHVCQLVYCQTTEQLSFVSSQFSACQQVLLRSGNCNRRRPGARNFSRSRPALLSTW